MTAVSYSTFFIIVALMFGLIAIALLYIWVLTIDIRLVNHRIDKNRDWTDKQNKMIIDYDIKLLNKLNEITNLCRIEVENTNDSE